MTSPASGDVCSRMNAEKLDLTTNARRVLEARYLKKDERGHCTESPEDLFHRVARTIADVEAEHGASYGECQKWEAAFYQLIARGDFMPNSPTLMNAGREMGMLSACFVLPVRDSITEIFNSIKHTALIQKAGGGTGFAFDELRPTGDYIRSSGGTTSGPISFWRAFSEATNAIQQGAFRRGANMGMMYIHHPDILKFLHAKQDLNQFTNYNISVKITDTWMEEFLADPDAPHVVRNPRNGKAFLLSRDLDIWEYNIRSLIEVDCVEPVSDEQSAAYFTTPRLIAKIPAEYEGKVYTKRDVWDFIVKNAWQTGEPGVVFIDRINDDNPTPQIGRIEATNPCGEQPLLPYEACNLGSINLGNFITNPCTPEADVDWERLRRTVQLSTRFLDNVIDANNYPLPEIANICQANRKIGLGIMGFADALFKLSVAYNTEEGVKWASRFMKFINDEAHDYSEHLARHRGCFPNWQGSVWQTKHNRLMRNAAVTTVAPTGTISIISNCSGGIEPLFSLAFVRNVLRGQRKDDTPMVEVNEIFRNVAQQRGLPTDELFERLAHEGTLHHIDGVPEDVKRVFVCAHDISPDWHMRMQAAFQQHCDASISKTINFPHAASVRDVEDIYRLAFEMKCKGVTVYRDGCRDMQPMALKKDTKTEAEAPQEEPQVDTVDLEDEIDDEALLAEANVMDNDDSGADMPAITEDEPAPVVAVEETCEVCEEPQAEEETEKHTHIPVPPRIEPQDLPEIVSGLRIRQLTPFGNMHVKITVDPHNDRELEVFAQLGKGGDVATSDLEAICRMISLWLRSGGNLRHVIKQLEGIGSSLQIPTRTGRIMSLGDGLAVTLKKYLRAKERFGLRSLLLGQIDLSDLDNPHRPPHSPEMVQTDRPLKSAKVVEQSVVASRVSDLRVLEGRERGESKSGRARASIAAGSNGNGNGNGHDNDAATVGTAVEEPPKIVSRDITEVITLTEDQQALVGMSDVAVTVAAPSNGNGVKSVAAPMGVHQPRDKAAHYKVKCPECGGGLAIQEGCRKCHGCGWAAC